MSMREEGYFPLFLGMVRTSLRQSCGVRRILYLLLIASIIGSCITSFFLLESANLSIRPELRIDMKSDTPNAVRQQLLTVLQSIPGVSYPPLPAGQNILSPSAQIRGCGR